MEQLISGKYYHIVDDKLKMSRDVFDVPMGHIFCYVDDVSFHFGERHMTLIAHFLKEEKRDLNISMYDKLIEYAQI